MADFKLMMGKLNQKFAVLAQKIKSFFLFLGNKLRNFRNLTLGEQISYSTIGSGLFLILVSMVLFIA